MKLKQIIFSFILGAGPIATAQADPNHLLDSISEEKKECSDQDYREKNGPLCNRVDELLKILSDSNHIDAIHEHYLQKGVQMEMEFVGGNGPSNSAK